MSTPAGAVRTQLPAMTIAASSSGTVVERNDISYGIEATLLFVLLPTYAQVGIWARRSRSQRGIDLAALDAAPRATARPSDADRARG